MRLGTFLAIIFHWVLVAFAVGQSAPSPPADQNPPFPPGTSLVLLDIFTVDSKTGLPLNKLKREDFQVLENGKPVAIETFDSGVRYDTRPITLWLLVLGN